jgi:hypothetical protein
MGRAADPVKPPTSLRLRHLPAAAAPVINLERKWSVAYGGLTWGRPDLDYYSHLARLSPDYSWDDVKAIDKAPTCRWGRSWAT